MAIVYLGAKRLQGTKVDRKSDSLGSDADGTNSGITLLTGAETLKNTPDLTEDFSGSDNWTDSDSGEIGVNTTDNDLDFDMKRDGTNDTCVYDLQHADALNGSNANDTKWTLRFKINFSAISGGSGNGNDIWIGLSDKDESAGSTTSQDFIGIDMNMDGTNVMRSATTNDGTFPLGSGSSTVNWTPSTSTDYYVQIIRTSSTNSTIDIFSDSSYSTKVFTTLSFSVSSATQSLRYIKIANRVNGGGGRNITGTIDDVKFYDNSISKASDSKLGSGAYSFDGTNDYVECGTTGTFNFLHTPNTKFTICGWFKRSTAEANSLETLLTTFNNGVSSASGIRIMYDDRSGESCDRSMRFNWQGNATDLNNETITHQVFPNDTDWHHLTVTGDLTTTTDAFKIYIDGTLKFSPNLTGTPIDEDHNIALRFGVEGDGTDYGNWNLDDWGFFNRVLTATEIGKLANNNSPSPNITDSPAYTKVGTTVSASGTTIEATNCQSNQNPVHRVYKDIGSVSDSTFYFEFDYKQKQNANNLFPIALQSGTGKTNIASEDMIYLKTDGLNMTVAKKNGGSNTNSSDGWITIVANTQYYCSITRSSNTASLKVYSDSSRSTQVGGTKTVSVSDVSGLQYIHSESRGDGGGGTNMGWICDNIVIYNGATSKPNSSFQTNSIWSETDTGKDFLFGSDGNWTEVA